MCRDPNKVAWGVVSTEINAHKEGSSTLPFIRPTIPWNLVSPSPVVRKLTRRAPCCVLEDVHATITKCPRKRHKGHQEKSEALLHSGHRQL